MKALLIAALVLAAPSAFAKTEGIGPAGCGLGNTVFGKDNQVLAATTNGTSGNQTFGITSGTSNCDAAGGTAMVNFIETNQVALENDAARGQGETLTTLASMMGCQDAATLGTALKANYQPIFETNKGNAYAITQSIKATVRRDERLARMCPNVG